MKKMIILVGAMMMLFTPKITHGKTVSMGLCKCTGYCPCSLCSDDFGRETSTGTTATAGRTVAVDPDVIGYGWNVLIDGETYVAEDCGGKVKGDSIDIFFDTHEEVEEFGVRYKIVWLQK